MAAWHGGAGLLLLVFQLMLPIATAAQSTGAPDEVADPGTSYFHRAAQHFLADDLEAARATVEDGLDAAPDHPKLQALREQIDALPPEPSASDQGTAGGGTDGDETDAGESESDAPSDGGAPAPNSSGEADQETSPPGETQDENDPSESEAGAADPDAPAFDTPPPGADPSPTETSPEAHDAPSEAAPEPTSSASPSASPPEERPTLTRAQAEQLLQLMEAQDQPLMHAMRSFEDATPSTRDW